MAGVGNGPEIGSEAAGQVQDDSRLSWEEIKANPNNIMSIKESMSRGTCVKFSTHKVRGFRK